MLQEATEDPTAVYHVPVGVQGQFPALGSHITKNQSCVHQLLAEEKPFKPSMSWEETNDRDSVSPESALHFWELSVFNLH